MSLILALIASSASADPNACSATVNAGLAANHNQLFKNAFATARNGAQYVGLLGSRFYFDANGLSANSHWLDAGAAEALAMSDLSRGIVDRVTRRSIQIKSRRLTALAIQKPRGFDESALFPENGKRIELRYLEGKYLEDYTFDEIGVCDLITDVMGPLSYTAQVDTVLRKYLELLAVGGRLYVYYKPGSIQIDGMRFEDYLQRLGGVRVTTEGSALRLEKIGWTGDASVPSLRLREFYPGSPPTRIYSAN